MTGSQTFVFRAFPAKAFAPLTLFAPVQNQFRFSGSAFPQLPVQMLDLKLTRRLAPPRVTL